MVKDSAYKYNLGDTVRVGNPEGKLGIIEEIVIQERLRFSNLDYHDPKSEDRKVEYQVRTEAIAIFPHSEDHLYGSDVQLHKDAFRVKDGQIFLKEGTRYLVEEAKIVHLPKDQKDDNYHRAWIVKAKDFSSGKYDPNSRSIEFEQGRDEVLEIVGEIKKRLSFS